jgi:hypothetical protein
MRDQFFFVLKNKINGSNKNKGTPINGPNKNKGNGKGHGNTDGDFFGFFYP